MRSFFRSPRAFAGEWDYGHGPLAIRVERIRHDLCRFYDTDVWLTGTVLDQEGRPVGPVTDVLVRLPALHRELAAAVHQGT